MAHKKVIKRVSDNKFLVSISQENKLDTGIWVDNQNDATEFEGTDVIFNRARCTRRGVETESIITVPHQ